VAGLAEEEQAPGEIGPDDGRNDGSVGAQVWCEERNGEMGGAGSGADREYPDRGGGDGVQWSS